MTHDHSHDHFVKDLSLAGFGRQEITLAEHEMPGLMATRRRHGPTRPLQGARVLGSLHLTVQTAVLIETLRELGADVRWCSCNVFSTQDHAAAAMAAAGVPVFAYKGETLEEYWDFTLRAMTWPDGGGPTLLVDDGGDATLMIHRGAEAERDPARLEAPPTDKELAVMNQVLRRRARENPRFFRDLLAGLRGVSEETTTGVRRLYRLEQEGRLRVPAINVNDAVTKSKLDNIYGCRESLVDGIRRATDLMLAGKVALVCGYGDVGKGSAQALDAARMRVLVTEVDPICALQAALAGYRVTTVEDALPEADLVVTATGCCDVITVEHLARMKHRAVVCNIGHFDDEIQVGALLAVPGLRRTTIKPQVDLLNFPDGHEIILLAEGRLVNLGCATGHPSFVMSTSFTNQVLAQLRLWSAPHEPRVYRLDPRLDEEVARLHLDHLGVKLTTLNSRQADYLGVPAAGPYKPAHYRY